MQTPVRFSSCRGVAFEIKPNPRPFAISAPSKDDPEGSSGSWFSWLHRDSSSYSKLHPSAFKRSVSRPSSHFCDLELEDEDAVDVQQLEEGKQQEKEPDPIQLPPPTACKLEQQKPNYKPAKKPPGSRISIILLDQGLFTVYKRLFAVSLTLNLTGLILAATGHFPYARNKAGLFTIANIFASILCRSEAFLRIVFWLVVKLFGRSWIPLPIKTASTSLLQSLGGIHSSCGVASIAWLIYALVLTLKYRDNTSSEIIGVASTILALLCLSALAAFPLVRHLHHNVFERTHRICGWTSLALVWVYVMLTNSYDPITKSYKKGFGSQLVKEQEFWFTVAMTFLIILPWVTVRRVPVKIYSPSGHASLIKFQGGVKAGVLGRISPSPLSEWHAFGIISDGKTEHMMLAGAVGDFTKSLVSNPPSHLWVRQVHFTGLPYLINLYDRVFSVSTGSGICVVLSSMLQPTRAKLCVLWVAKGIEQNFGKEIKEMMSRFPEDEVIVHDTAILGRPNVAQMSVDYARKFGAEVVFVTSNPEGTRDIVSTCKASGIPAFGPIWDS